VFIQGWQEREERLRLARAAIAMFEDYPRRIKPPKRQETLGEFAQRHRRGVYELEFAPPGRRAFHMVAANGEVGYVDFPAHWATRDLVKNLWRRLDREDPPRAEIRLLTDDSIHPDE
jgi:hypothetical protein